MRFHSCGLEIGHLYKQLRRLKSRYEGHEKDEEFYKELQAIDEKYFKDIFIYHLATYVPIIILTLVIFNFSCLV